MASLRTLYAVSVLTLGFGVLACPKPPDPFVNKPLNGEEAVDPEDVQAEQTQVTANDESCTSFDWTRPDSIPPAEKSRCQINGFAGKIAGCFPFDWKSTPEGPSGIGQLCLQSGMQARLATCDTFNWTAPDTIEPQDRTFCERLGYFAVVDTTVCEKQDWMKPDTIPAFVKEQCLRVTIDLPKFTCDKKKNPKLCAILEDGTKSGKAFTHAVHGFDLPGQPKTKGLPKKDGRDLKCNDCHLWQDPKTSKERQTFYHGACDSCHGDFLENRNYCVSCHKDEKNMKKVLSYDESMPPPSVNFGFNFDHASHLDPNSPLMKERGRLGSCDDCHALKPADKKAKKGSVSLSGDMGTATHKECSKCHNAKDARVKMEDCMACHTGQPDAVSGHAYLNYRPHAQQFNHLQHQDDYNGDKIACETCHVSVKESRSLDQIAVPPMLGCLQSCHSGEYTKKNNPKVKKEAFDGWVECSGCHAPGELPESKTQAEKKKTK